jgi:hypothetical protein
VTGTALIPLCQECRRPLAVYEQLVMFPDSLAWPTVVEACYGCETEALTERSLRVRWDNDGVTSFTRSE